MSDEIEEVETEGPIDQENDQDSLESLKKDLQYALAEVANIRARAAKERSEMMRYGSKNLGLRMIEVLVSLEMAISTMDESSESVINGVRLTVESMRQGLSSVGITPIDLDGKVIRSQLHGGNSDCSTSRWRAVRDYPKCRRERVHDPR